MNDAHVFEEGTFTMVLNDQGTMSVYVGSKKLSVITHISVTNAMYQSPHVEITFPKRFGTDVDLKIEENMRVASTFPWIKVKRET